MRYIQYDLIKAGALLTNSTVVKQVIIRANAQNKEQLLNSELLKFLTQNNLHITKKTQYRWSMSKMLYSWEIKKDPNKLNQVIKN